MHYRKKTQTGASEAPACVREMDEDGAEIHICDPRKWIKHTKTYMVDKRHRLYKEPGPLLGTKLCLGKRT